MKVKPGTVLKNQVILSKYRGGPTLDALVDDAKLVSFDPRAFVYAEDLSASSKSNSGPRTTVTLSFGKGNMRHVLVNENVTQILHLVAEAKGNIKNDAGIIREEAKLLLREIGPALKDHFGGAT